MKHITNGPLPKHLFNSFLHLYETAKQKNYFNINGEIVFVTFSQGIIHEPDIFPKKETDQVVEYTYTPNFLAEQLYQEQKKKAEEYPDFSYKEAMIIWDTMYKYAEIPTEHPLRQKLDKMVGLSTKNK